MLFDTEKRVVLFGGAGMLGRAFGHALVRRNGLTQIVGLSSARANFLDPTAFERTLDEHVELVINCAAMTDVDGAEGKKDEAFEINGHAVGRLGLRCAELGVPVVHLSTDYIFDGDQDGSYGVGATPNPINVYGESKLLGERLLAGSGAEHLIVRTSWLYASWGKNFVRTIHRLACERESLKVVSDQTGKPSSATQVADAALALFDKRVRGVRHASGGGTCTWFELARETVRLAGLDCEVRPCTSQAYETAATRPINSVLDLSETTKHIGAMNHWRDELAVTVAEICGRQGRWSKRKVA